MLLLKGENRVSLSEKLEQRVERLPKGQLRYYFQGRGMGYWLSKNSNYQQVIQQSMCPIIYHPLPLTHSEK